MTDEELTAAIREVQQRARARVPQGGLGLEGVEAADLMPLVHARDAAQAKVAAIGTVNPRPPGLLNSAVQTAKRAAARALDWHVREQVEFNRAAMACVEASIAAMTGISRSVAALAAHTASDRTGQQAASAAAESRHKELQGHIQELRAVCDRQTAALEEFRVRQAALLSDFESHFQAQVQELRREQDARLEASGRHHGERIETLRQEHAAEMETLRQEHAAQLEASGKEHAAQMEILRQEHATHLEALRHEYGAQAEALRYE